MANGYVRCILIKHVSYSLDDYSASLIVGLVFVIVASLLAYFFSPKGDTQTYVSLATTTSSHGWLELQPWGGRISPATVSRILLMFLAVSEFGAVP